MTEIDEWTEKEEKEWKAKHKEMMANLKKQGLKTPKIYD